MSKYLMDGLSRQQFLFGHFSMKYFSTVIFENNKAATESMIEVEVDVSAAIKSWRLSLFSFQWLNKDGGIKPLEDLIEQDQIRRAYVENAVMHGHPIQKPIMGIGLSENVEIGSGRAEFLTLAAMGFERIPVHIPAANAKEFKKFLSKK